MQYLVLAFEIKVNGTIGNTCLTGYIGDLRIEVALAGKHLYCGPKDRFAFIGDDSTCRSICVSAAGHVSNTE